MRKKKEFDLDDGLELVFFHSLLTFSSKKVLMMTLSISQTLIA